MMEHDVSDVGLGEIQLTVIDPIAENAKNECQRGWDWLLLVSLECVYLCHQTLMMDCIVHRTVDGQGHTAAIPDQGRSEQR